MVEDKYPYKDLEKYFTLPVRMRVITGSFYGKIKIPRKLKKKVKKHCGVHWNLLKTEQKLWSYMDENNPNYKRFLIKMICKYYEQESNNKR